MSVAALALAILAVALPPQDDKERRDATMKRILQGLTDELRTIAIEKTTLLWVVDKSSSMSDDREHLSRQIETTFSKLATKSQLSMGVVAYDEEASLVLPVTGETVRVKEALGSVGSAGGGKENLPAAIRLAVSSFTDPKALNALVVVTDEKGGRDADLLGFLPALKRAGVRVYVFGRESVFGWPHAFEADKESGFAVAVDGGPETAGVEMLQANPFCCVKAHFVWCHKMSVQEELNREAFHFYDNPLRSELGFDDKVPSGFGCYALEYLCRETGGIYFALREKETYTAKALEGYEPEWIPLEEWQARNRKNRLRRTVVAVLDEIHKGGDLDLTLWIVDPGEGKGIAGRVPKVEEQFVRWIGDLQKAAKTSVDTGGIEKQRRWRANADLLEAQLWSMMHYLEQYRLALDEGPYPKSESVVVGYTISAVEKVRGDGKLTSKAQEKLKFVIEQHPGTPWARTAELLSQNLVGYEMIPLSTGPVVPVPKKPDPK